MSNKCRIDPLHDDLYKLLDSGNDTGCDGSLIVVDKKAYMKLHKWFEKTYGIHCGYINEEVEEDNTE